jgi:hypothetical protein
MPWTGHGTRADGTVFVTCGQFHTFELRLDPEQVLAFQLAVKHEQLLSRPMWIVGEDHPVSDDPHMRLTPDFCKPGMNLSIHRVPYVVDHVEVDRVWIRPVSSN